MKWDGSVTHLLSRRRHGRVAFIRNTVIMTTPTTITHEHLHTQTGGAPFGGNIQSKGQSVQLHALVIFEGRYNRDWGEKGGSVWFFEGRNWRWGWGW